MKTKQQKRNNEMVSPKPLIVDYFGKVYNLNIFATFLSNIKTEWKSKVKGRPALRDNVVEQRQQVPAIK